ncbi:Gfo/Idh/MocA family protein [Salinibacterium sp. NK8237]|uniref:Gfo/Idh/MocA family protein n=1 Tax=Salinibacterium sp. NK8237 TaxID=2792038 RepID=UPI0018CE3507|nr:Gfo/Idh/MocA family oxidoreductase [Salinibacterium sp. NK8237]MBH0131159.1 Gfo/Idh/MocA family oxidoreductase [Salinibacterium sp. NK8237]
MTFSVAIVGNGIIGYNHAKAIVAHGELEIVALIDAVPEASSALADFVENDLKRPRPVTATSLSGAAPADIVVICTPSGLHVSLAEEAIAAGSNVVIEKPLDSNLPRARRIAAIARQAEAQGLVVSVISQHRFDPASVVVFDAIERGRFGRITSAVASVPWWRSQEYYDSGNWRGTWELDGGGAVMNQGVHTVDLLRWLLGTPVSVSAETARLAHDRIEVEDTAVATIRFESGALAVVHATTAAFPGMTVSLQVHGSQGSAIIQDDQLAYFYAADEPSEPEAVNQAAAAIAPEELYGAEKDAEAFAIGHLRQYQDIVQAIDNGTAPGVTVDDALLSLVLVQAIYISASQGKPVAFADVVAGKYDDTERVTGGTA